MKNWYWLVSKNFKIFFYIKVFPSCELLVSDLWLFVGYHVWIIYIPASAGRASLTAAPTGFNWFFEVPFFCFCFFNTIFLFFFSKNCFWQMFNTYKLKTVFKELLVVKKDKTIFWFFPSFFAFLYIFLKNWFCMFSLTAAPCMALLRHLISLLKSYFLMFFWIPKFWQDLYIAKLHVIFFLFFMVFLKAVMAQLIRLDLFLQTYFSIFCVENCFVIFFFCNCAMHGAVETFNSIFYRVNFWYFFEYQRFGRICCLFDFVWRIL